MLLIIGLLGLAAMTWLFPLVAALVPMRSKPASGSSSGEQEPLRVTVVVPVHNEAAVLEQTLASINRAIASARRAKASLECRLLVAADGCTDCSAAVARQLGAEVVEFTVRRGKWQVLQDALREASASEWIIFADAGVLWRPDFLLALAPYFRRAWVAGVAPAYCNAHAGAAEMLHWRLEASLKRFENRAGGPVTVHGATVAYRRGCLEAVFEKLAGGRWHNDDVVIPLMLRGLFPDMRLEYLAHVHVEEALHLEGAAAEGGRRRRMARGNVQWISLLLGSLWRLNPQAAILGLRRVFRLLWAYWLAAFALGCLSFLGAGLEPRARLALGMCVLAAAALAAAVRGLRRILSAAQASFAAPIYWLCLKQDEVKWS